MIRPYVYTVQPSGDCCVVYTLSLRSPCPPALLHIHQRLKAVVFLGDPLHVFGPVWASGAKRCDVVNVVARAGAACASGGGAGVLGTEGSDLGAVAFRPRGGGRGQCATEHKGEIATVFQGILYAI